MKSFLRDTFLGGLFVVIPLTLVAMLVHRVYEILNAALAPLEAWLPIRPAFPGMWAMLVLVVLCFVAGLLLRLPGMEGASRAGKTMLARVFPPARTLLGIEQALQGGESGMHAAFLETDDGLAPAFVLEKMDDGSATVFLPSSPRASEGTILVVPASRVHRLDASIAQVIRCVSQRGYGASELLKRRQR